MRLYEHSLSSYSRKVKIAVREKEIAFDAVTPEDFGTERTDTAFAAANPRRNVPVLLTDEAVAIFES